MAILGDFSRKKPPAGIARPTRPTRPPATAAPDNLGDYAAAGARAVRKPDNIGEYAAAGARPQARAPRMTSPSAPAGAYSGGGLGAMSTGVVAEQAPVPAQTFDDWRNAGGFSGDSAFMAEDASAEAEYQALLNQLTQQNSSYMQDFKGGLRNLGWDYEGEDFGKGQWDANDRLGAYGGAFQNLQNDFSGRGLMDSSFYGQAQNDLTDRFNRQRTDMQTGLNTQQNEFNSNKTNALKSREAAKNRALAEAYSRYSGGFGV